MIPAPELALFAVAALIMVLTPGPNMIYLVSRWAWSRLRSVSA